MICCLRDLSFVFYNHASGVSVGRGRSHKMKKKRKFTTCTHKYIPQILGFAHIWIEYVLECVSHSKMYSISRSSIFSKFVRI